MKVIQPGINPETWRKEVKCTRCECHLKISWQDIHILTTRKYSLFSYKHILHYYIKCSECSSKIELSEEKLPYIIKKKVYDNMGMVDRLLNFYFT